VLADLGAAAALDALVGIEDERGRGGIVLAVVDLLRERNFTKFSQGLRIPDSFVLLTEHQLTPLDSCKWL
jgi:hypothetical protein